METLTRSSDHLKEALDLRVRNDADGKPKIVHKKRLVLIGIKRGGEKGFKLKSV